MEVEDIVQTSAAFILPLTEGTLRTQVCQHEIRQTSSAGLEIIVVYDSDMRRASSIDLGEREHMPEVPVPPIYGKMECLPVFSVLTMGRFYTEPPQVFK